MVRLSTSLKKKSMARIMITMLNGRNKRVFKFQQG